MRGIARIVVVVLVLALAVVLAIFAASELGGEVVTLQTRSPDGAVETRTWVVDDGGYAWLRSGTPGNGWLLRIEADPDVQIERDGEKSAFRAVPVLGDPAVRDRIHALMREKYTWADRLVSLMRDGSKSVPIRLEPVDAGDPTVPPASGY
jgi:hypothetical protein